jgi:predicted nucleic acid-binding protein
VVKKYVLDTSALFAFIQDEEGADRVQNILVSAQKNECSVYISFISLAELLYVTWQEEGESAARALVSQVKSLPLSIIESEERLTLAAGRIKASFYLSLGDAFIAAAAQIVSGTLVHKDPEFLPVAGIISLEELPFKPKKNKK